MNTSRFSWLIFYLSLVLTVWKLVTNWRGVSEVIRYLYSLQCWWWEMRGASHWSRLETGLEMERGSTRLTPHWSPHLIHVLLLPQHYTRSTILVYLTCSQMSASGELCEQCCVQDDVNIIIWRWTPVGAETDCDVCRQTGDCHHWAQVLIILLLMTRADQGWPGGGAVCSQHWQILSGLTPLPDHWY